MTFSAIRDATVAELMTLEPVCVRIDDTLEEAEGLLVRYGITGLPVVDAEGVLVGILSQTDLVHLRVPGASDLPRHRTKGGVGEFMSLPAITIPLGAPVVDAARLMTDREIHRLVAVDEQGRPVGVLAAMDIVRLVAEV